jgi:hypothetical protein
MKRTLFGSSVVLLCCAAVIGKTLAEEYLTVGADAILGTNSTSLPVSPVCNVALSASRVGSKIVLSWPASATPSQLYAMPSVAPAEWTPVLLQPTLTNDNFVVTLPLSGSACYFRLQAQ